MLLLLNKININTDIEITTARNLLLTKKVITKFLPKEDAYTNTTIIPPRNTITKEKKNQDASQNTRDNLKEKDTIITDSLIQKGDLVHNTAIIPIAGHLKSILIN